MSINWRDDWSIGVYDIDSQHKELFRRINALLDACNQGRGNEEVASTINFLGTYVETHFRAEENLMLKNNYPDYKSHKEIHENFIKSFKELDGRFKTEGVKPYLIIETNRIVVNWLIAHIQNIDKKFGTYFKEKQSQLSFK